VTFLLISSPSPSYPPVWIYPFSWILHFPLHNTLNSWWSPIVAILKFSNVISPCKWKKAHLY
jgi:hypothetical protein